MVQTVFHIVMVAVDVSKGGDLWCDFGLMEQIQGEFGWFQEVAPQRERELVVHAFQK